MFSYETNKALLMLIMHTEVDPADSEQLYGLFRIEKPNVE